MKFLQLLGKELNEWPPKADWSVCVISTRGEVRASFGRGDKPKPDPIDRKFHTWTICEPETNADWLGERRVLSEKASDQLTAIVTRADWEAERAKLKAPKANVDGWVRHRGGKCPVEAGALVDYRMRSGLVMSSGRKSSELDWSVSGDMDDIMAYRIHKPAEQPAMVSEETIKATEPGKFDAIAIRDRILALDTQRAEVESTYQRQISEITQERESLVQKLAGEGLALVEVVVDWREWKKGDVVMCVSQNHKWSEKAELGAKYQLSEDPSKDDEHGLNIWVAGFYMNPADFKFVSRPDS